jgi:MoaA/NifB/PqqE/SkfB family radical SAM enzyme
LKGVESLNMRKFGYFIKCGFECFVLKREKPIVAGIALTDVCNLHCSHCVVNNKGRGHYPYDRIVAWLKHFYKKGARIIYFQGGEPFGWHDKEKTLDDLVGAAKSIGYYKVAVASNGTYPIATESDIVWISIDGVPEHHDEIRGKGVYEEVMKNIRDSAHPHICINTTLNTVNYRDVGKVIESIGKNPKIHGISVNFHTPYPGVEGLLLSREQKVEVAEQVIALKKAGYPVLNSISGLRALAGGNYKRPLWTIEMVEQDKINRCCWGSDYGDEVCKNCGYGIIAEMSQVFRFNPESILHAFKLF